MNKKKLTTEQKVKDTVTKVSLETGHQIDRYISLRLEQLNWKPKDLVVESTISKSELSKLSNGITKKLFASKFYLIYKAFGDSIEDAVKIVYPNLDLTLKDYIEKERNEFGKFMSAYEKNENSIEIITVKTDIDPQRMKELYYLSGALEADELLLIEKAANKNPGELFEGFFGKKNK